MNKTSIEWALNPDGTPGYTWNPITGCLNGCEYCYARKLANGRLKTRYLTGGELGCANNRELIMEAIHDPFYPRLWPERLEERMPPVARAQSYMRYGKPCSETFAYRKYDYKPKGIFVCDMSDLFGIGIPEEWTRKVLGVIKCNPKDRFYLLTKQPQNLAKFSPFPDNCWVGVTATSFDMFAVGIHYLSKIKAKVKYISFEPLLAAIDIKPFRPEQYYKWVDWVIIGAQTKPTVQPKIEWVIEIVKACSKAGVAVFLKDNLKPLIDDWHYKSRTMGDMAGYELELRQELPG